MANETPDGSGTGRFYASALLAGVLVYVILVDLDINALVVVRIPIVTIFAIRILSLRYGWGVPTFDIRADRRDDEDSGTQP